MIDQLSPHQRKLLKLDLYWQLGRLEWKLHAKQKEIFHQLLDNPTQESLLLISRQFGKSYLMAVYALSFCLRHPKALVRIAAPTLKQAYDIVNDNLNPIIADAPKGLVNKTKSEYRWTVGQSELRLGVLEKAHVDSLRGGNAKLIICEEGGFVKSDDYEYAVKSVLAPQLLHSGGQLIHVTTPSSEPSHYIHEQILPRCSLAKSLHRYTVYDNPLLSEDQIGAAMSLCGGEDSVAWQREYLVEIVRDASSVCVPEFDPKQHVTANIPKWANYTVATDFGGVRDKTVGLLLAYDFTQAITVVTKEIVFEPNTDTRTILNGLQTLSRPSCKIVADAHGQTLVDLRSMGYDAVLPNKDDWTASLNNVRTLLNSKKLQIHEGCVFLKETLKGATFNKQKTDFARSDALGHADALAALMYGCRHIDRHTNPVPKEVATFNSFQLPQKTENRKLVEAIFGRRR